MRSKLTPIIVLLICACSTMNIVEAQVQVDNRFTYQGKLEENGQAANGNFDFTFTLFNAENGGSQVGNSQAVENLPVANGEFTAELDFGDDAFSGDFRWLQIDVNATTLLPRQRITAAPYASYSINTRGINVNSNNSFVGIGRDQPLDSAEVFGIEAQTAPGVANFGGMYVRSTGGLSNAFYGYDSGGLFSGRHWIDGVFGSWRLESSSAQSTKELLRVSRNGDFRTAQADSGSAHINVSSDDVRLGSTDSTEWRVNILEDGFVGLMRDTPILDGASGNSWLDLQTPAGNNQFGGMHVATDGTGGIPFYGYSAGGSATNAFTFFNGGVNRWGLRMGGQDWLSVNGSNGRVGISTTNPAALLDVNGSGNIATNLDVGLNLFVGNNAFKPGGGVWSVASDRRLKKNVQNLEGTLEKLLSLRGVTFEYIDPKTINELDGERIGMIAQEVEKVFPDWVEERENGYKMLTIRGFEALAVEAMRELKAEADSDIEQLKQENEDLRFRLETLEAAVAELKSN